jgi:hypothetical protein
MGEWKIIDSSYRDGVLRLGVDGAVDYMPPSNADLKWRGERWHARNGITKTTQREAAWLYNFPLGREGPQLLVRLRSQSGGDELCFEGNLEAGGVPGALLLRGTCTRRDARTNVPGDLRRYMHTVEGPFVMLRQ